MSYDISSGLVMPVKGDPRARPLSSCSGFSNVVKQGRQFKKRDSSGRKIINNFPADPSEILREIIQDSFNLLHDQE